MENEEEIDVESWQLFNCLPGLRKNAMVAIHHELNRLAGPGHSNWISQVHRQSSLLSEFSLWTFKSMEPILYMHMH